MAILSDPRHYDYSGPTRRCDVVMKGGITSGVVYPHAICELARVYRFARVGGTSAGAIAAAAAAAAEYGRECGGFAKLANLPDWLGAGTNLSGLFQPQRGTRPGFRVLMAAVGAKSPGAILRKVVLAAVCNFPLAFIGGALPGVAISVASAVDPDSGLLKGVGVVAGGVMALLGGMLWLAYRSTAETSRQISANGFGLCSGMPSGGAADQPAITPWLAEVLDDIAGRFDGTPLTFRDLEQRGIELEMMTTNITQRRSQRLPFAEQDFFFDPDEWRTLFPDRIVDWMVAHPAALPTNETGGPSRIEESVRIRNAMRPRLPLPAAADLPVVVAARMSLSFPLLISAIPLWAIDWPPVDKAEAPKKDTQPPIPQAERCWFSDGGISSNFPIHFFDSALPKWPTFAIDLAPFPRHHSKSPDENENVWLPNRNGSGLLGGWYRFPDQPGLGRLGAFLSGVVRTMQNRVDSSLARQPGYRDRIAHVFTDASEGGMNLSMPECVIKALTLRGQMAAGRLVGEFAETPGTALHVLSWDNHRWVRYRNALAAIGEQLAEITDAWSAPPSSGERSYEELALRDDTVGPSGYRFTNLAQRDLALSLTSQLVAAGNLLKMSPVELDADAPHPLQRAQISPRE